MHNCQDIRDNWLERSLERPEATLDGSQKCSDCAAWLMRTQLQVRALTCLLPAPLPRMHVDLESLKRCIDDTQDVAGVPLAKEIEDGLGHLHHLHAPDGLRALVHEDLVAHRDDSIHVESLRNIESQASPSVLDRLVNEELGAPLTYQSARILSRLELRMAPMELDALVAEGMLLGQSKATRLRWVGWISVLAAGVLGWLSLRGNDETQQAPSRRLQIVHATSLAELSPLAQGHMQALRGSLDVRFTERDGSKR